MKLQKTHFAIIALLLGGFIAPYTALAVDQQPTEEIIIAILDNGWNFSNTNIQSYLHVNTGETGIDSNGLDKRFNGIDDDNNGYKDDVHGYNTVDENGDVDAKGDDHPDQMAENVVLWLQAGERNFGRPTRCRIMPMRCLGTMEDLAEAYEYLRKNSKVKIICLPLKFGINNDLFSDTVEQGIGLLYGRKNENGDSTGALTVIAAGQQQRDTSQSPTWPANYFRRVPCLTVGAVDANGNYVGGSNFAPDMQLMVRTYGVNTITHGPNFGTSGSSSIAAGMAAVVADFMNVSHPWGIMLHLIASSQKISSLVGRVAQGAVADFQTAVNSQFSFTPPSIVSLGKAKDGKQTGSYSHVGDKLTSLGYPDAKVIMNDDLTFKIKPGTHGQFKRPAIVTSPKLGGIDIKLEN